MELELDPEKKRLVEQIIELKIPDYGDKYLDYEEWVTYFPEKFQKSLTEIRGKEHVSVFDILLTMFSFTIESEPGIEPETELLYNENEQDMHFDNLFNEITRKYLSSLSNFKLKAILADYADTMNNEM